MILLYFSLIISFWSSPYLNFYPTLGEREWFKWLVWPEALLIHAHPFKPYVSVFQMYYK